MAVTDRHEGKVSFAVASIRSLPEATSLVGKGGVPIVFRRVMDHTSATNSDSHIKTNYKIRVVDAWIRKIAAGSGSTAGTLTAQLQTSTGGAISDAISIKVVAGAIGRATNLSTAHDVVAKDAVIRWRKVGTGEASSTITATRSHAYEAMVLAVRTS